MNPGRLNHRVTIWYIPSADDGQGGRTQRGRVLTELCKVWAEFKRPKTSTEIQTGAPVSIVTQEVIIRRRDDIKIGYQLVDGANTYKITNIYYPDAESTGLMVEEVARRAS